MRKLGRDWERECHTRGGGGGGRASGGLQGHRSYRAADGWVRVVDQFCSVVRGGGGGGLRAAAVAGLAGDLDPRQGSFGGFEAEKRDTNLCNWNMTEVQQGMF